MKEDCTKISVLAVEDQPTIQERLTNLFNGSTVFSLLAVHDNALRILEYLDQNSDDPPDLLLVDLELPGMKGDELIAICREKYPNLKMVVFTSFEDQSRILRLLKSGIKGYILKDTLDDLFLAELQVVQLGGASLTEKIAQAILADLYPREVLPADKNGVLTEREYGVINLIALGLNYRDIASELKLSPHTIRSHIENIYRKLEVNSKIQAVEKAKQLGILR